MKDGSKTENDLISAVFSYFKNKKVFGDVLVYEKVFCATQIEIAGCIADGLIFLNEPPRFSRIIGLEAKTNKDNYSRLYNQVNAYLAICDEVYLVIQDKVIPQDLPFYVGVIRVNEEIEIERYATSLKHSINASEMWVTLLKGFSLHCKVPKESDIWGFFNAIENIKRKLIWNQFVVGFHQAYVKDYIPLIESEKRIVKEYFNISYQKENV